MAQIPQPTGSFLSVNPLEPVLIFENAAAAKSFQAAYPSGRIYPAAPSWVYVPLPPGLLRARSALNCAMSWEFDNPTSAVNFHREIGFVGTIYPVTKEMPYCDSNVYIATKRKNSGIEGKGELAG